jgi:hypothetical protein
MKCFTTQQSPYRCIGIRRDGLRTRMEPHSRPKQRAQTRCSLAAAVRLRVVSEEMPGAEVVHTFVGTMRLVGTIASWCDAIPFGRVAGCAVPICRD